MFFVTEKIAEKIHLLRGYESQKEDNYCMVMNLCGDEYDKYEMKGFLSSRTLTISELKALIKYLQTLGMELYANVLKSDFKGFTVENLLKKFNYRIKMREISDIKKIIVHCSASTFGDVATIDRWHKERGWSGIGYHYVITNGVAKKHDQYDPGLDGLIQTGREWQKIGAHCKGQNRDSIGICLIGRHHFTAEQLLVALPNLLIMLGDLGICADNIFGHREFDKTKTCPNIDPVLIRNMVRLKRELSWQANKLISQ